MHLIVLQSPGAILFKIGSLSIRWYGVLIAFGFVCASYFAGRLAKKQGLDSEKLTNLTLICFIAGIIGARLYFVALNFNSYISRPQDILATWQGGLSLHGGIVGGFIAGWLYAKYNNMPKRQIADICGCIIPLGQAIGRWGNFFNSEAFGAPVPNDFPLAVFIPPDSRPLRFHDASYFHATFLYESIWDFGIFALIYFYLSKKLKAYPGLCFLIYLILYNFGRLLIEPLRTDSIMAGEIPVPIIASAFFLFLSIGLIPVILKFANDDKKKVLSKLKADESQSL
ncbi:MAG: prolipoprotein diacylglyceryl transferase [Candidatus Obscuribacterales bacterium]|nr:prolipoprotein diacylglyceryl transferase [Candidatus Obscuribacterales bacterium]